MKDHDPRTSLEIAKSALPLLITHAEPGPDPVLVLGGDDWGANFMCNWRIEGDGKWIDYFLSENDSESNYTLLKESDLKFLVGRHITDIVSNQDLVDPVFKISGNISLIVEADTDVDPWMLRVPGMVFVGARKA
jgi:hypothetical protein